MEALKAVILTDAQLRDMLAEAARQGAVLAVTELRTQLQQSPEDATVRKLRTYLNEPASITNPHDLWAHSGVICSIEPTPRGKPKSSAWFMKFQRETHLNECFNRPSPAYGRRREWSFFDIKLAWDAYYHRR